MLPCAILCGGLATRLRPVTEKIPKSLLNINGEPFIAHQLRLLESKGVKRVVLCAGHLGEMIRTFVRDGSDYNVSVSYSFDGEPLLGTAGAIRKALPLLDSAFFVLYGDSYLICDYASVAQAFASSHARALMTIYRNEGQFDTSNVEADAGLIRRYDKRNRTPHMHHIDYGLGVFSHSVFEELPPNMSLDLADVYRKLVVDGELASYEVNSRFYEIGSGSGIRDLEQYLEKQSGIVAGQ